MRKSINLLGFFNGGTGLGNLCSIQLSYEGVEISPVLAVFSNLVALNIKNPPDLRKFCSIFVAL